MTPTFSRLALTALLAALLALGAGCGGGESSDGGGATTTETSGTEPDDGGDEAEGDPSNVAYQGAFELCAEESVESLAGLYGIDPPTEDAVADAIAEQVAGGLGEADIEQGRLGCLAAFEEAG
jgi:hypothetical protein